MSWLHTSFRKSMDRPGRASPNPPRRFRVGRVCVCLLLLTSFVFSSGCGSTNWMKNGFLDPSQVGQFKEPRRNEIRSTLSILEEPPGIPSATEPIPEDLTPDFQEMKIGPGDMLMISILELLYVGQATELNVRVSNAGYVTLPELGPVKVIDLGPRELELAIREQLRERQLLDDAQVRVNVFQSQKLRFSVIGQIARPGMYPIPQPDFRLLDAVASMGGLPSQIEKLYIFRRTDALSEEVSPAAPVETKIKPIEPDAEYVPYTMSDFPSTSAGGRAPVSLAKGNDSDVSVGDEPPQPARDDVPTYDPETGEWVFAEPVSQPASQPASHPVSQSASQPASQPTVLIPATEGEPMHVGEDMASDRIEEQVYVVEDMVPDGKGDQAETSRVVEAATSQAEADDTIPTWGDEDELEPPIRIIEIPVAELLDGNPQYNIVIRPSDTINVTSTVGEYYMMGNIARAGAYSLSGRRITVKEAVAAAGGFGPLAWPARADLIRRVNQDEEQIIQLDLDAIFAGNAPDFYLRPNDILNVGTTPVSVFLAVLRNSFRFSYGLGFVYDRNFADSDSFGAREQVKARREASAARRGLPPS